MSEIFSFDYVPNYAPSKNEGCKKGDTKREVYYYEGYKEGKDQRKGFYMYFDESEIFKYTGESKSESKKLDSISTDDLYNELCVRMSERDELVVLLSVDKYKSLLDFERERKEFEEYKKAEMEKLSIDLSCSDIKDVSMFRNVHTLNLTDCKNVTDVSMLGNVHTLSLRGCKNVTDVSMLGNVHTLDVRFCSRISGVVHMLKNTCLFK